MNAIQFIAYYVVLITFYMGATSFLGTEFMSNFTEFMFGPYIELSQKYDFSRFIPSLTNPNVILILIAFVFFTGRGLINVSRHIAGFIIALFIFQLGASLLNITDSSYLSLSFSSLVIGCVIWVFMSNFFINRSAFSWLRSKLQEILS